jgi:hypothetical protein
MENVPILPEFVQYGVIGICIMLIVLVGYITKLYLSAILQLYAKIETLTGSITALSVKIENLAFYRRRKPEIMENSEE